MFASSNVMMVELHVPKQRPVFENCSCIADNLASQLIQQETYNGINDTGTPTSILLSNSTATDGRCDLGCNKLGLFLAFIAVALFLMFILQVPYVIITVRSDDDMFSLLVVSHKLLDSIFVLH